MPAEIIVRARYHQCANELFDRASHFADLIEATSKISTYKGLPSVRMEQGKRYTTNIKILGLIKCENYQIEIKKVCKNERVMESTEFSKDVSFWSHRLKIHASERGSVWTDHVILDAETMTPFVSRYARFMYKHRHMNRNGEILEATLRRATRPITANRPYFHPAE